MSIKSFGAKLFASYINNKNKRWIEHPVQAQRRVFQTLIAQGKHTRFGKDHRFDSIKTYADFVEHVPIVDYEGLKPYIEMILQGQSDVLWKGKPIYFAKTSGTTSGAKYIPLTKESMPYHITAARDAILAYIYQTGKSDFVDAKMIFLQGSPVLEIEKGIKLGRLSGIVAHYVPSYLQKNRLPSWQTNCIEQWETKVDKIVEETLVEKMGIISGIPSWVQMYFEKLQEVTDKKVGDIFPDFELFIYGGVNFEPYRAKFEQLIGRKIPSIELFPASEGFFAYQDSQTDPGLLLLLDGGIFYEFIKVEEFNNPKARRYTIGEVELDINYVLIISTNAGLWGYNIGDTVKFVNLNPYRVVVSGRIKHYISAFGEHVIGKEVETALQQAIEQSQAIVNEFTVAPQITPKNGLPYHQWFIEFEEQPRDLEGFASNLDKFMQMQNVYYEDLIVGGVLQPLIITPVIKGGFNNYMKKIGKLGGQNKLPRLCNDRVIADQLQTK